MVYMGVSEMAQKVFEGDVVFSILIGRFFLVDFLGHLRGPRVDAEDIWNSIQFEIQGSNVADKI